MAMITLKLIRPCANRVIAGIVTITSGTTNGKYPGAGPSLKFTTANAIFNSRSDFK